jgi:hypothetical protein
MSRKDVTAEFMRDIEKIRYTTLERLLSEYDQKEENGRLKSYHFLITS